MTEQEAAVAALHPMTAPEWDTAYRHGAWEWDEPPPPALTALFAEYAPAPADVLDVGSGAGTTARWLAERSYTVTGWDFSPEAVRIARELTPAALGVRYEVADLTAPPPTAAFPVVLDRGVLHTCPSRGAREGFVAAVARLCAPEGVWIHVGAAAGTPAEEIDRRVAPSTLTDRSFRSLVAPWFEVVACRHADYGGTPGVTDLPARFAVLRRHR